MTIGKTAASMPAAMGKAGAVKAPGSGDQTSFLANAGDDVLRIMKIAAAGLAVVIALVVGLASLQPDEFSIVRQASIKAPPEKVYAFLVDFRKWNSWSPWDQKDPAMQRSYSGPAAGVGAQYRWNGNDDFGAGIMEIREAVPWSRVAIRLTFERPMATTNTVVFMLSARDEGTDIEWAMTGRQPLIGKIFGLFVNIDRLVGADFERGLATLKTRAEES